MNKINLLAFLKESNRIEGIYDVSREETDAAVSFLMLMKPEVRDLSQYVQITTEGVGRLRNQVGMDVVVGNHTPPVGGPDVERKLKSLMILLLHNVTYHDIDRRAYEFHHQYETLHPYMDGNGRSGRLLWLWMCYKGTGDIPNNFLQNWYYQSLEFGGGRDR